MTLDKKMAFIRCLAHLVNLVESHFSMVNASQLF